MDFNKYITIQLLQTSVLLIHNLKSDQNKETLLNSGFYREILLTPFDFTDEEIIENYTSLLKGLAINISTSQLIQYLLHSNFALFTAALMFFNYPEALVRTASRTVVLRVLSGIIYIVNHTIIEAFVLESGFFVKILGYWKGSIEKIEQEIKDFRNLQRFETVVVESLDFLFYFNDIFMLEKEEYSRKLSEGLMRGVVMPTLIGSLIEVKRKIYHIQLSLAMFIDSQLIKVIKYRPFCEYLMDLMFSKELLGSDYKIIMQPPTRDLEQLTISDERIENPVRATIFCFLKCKEDNLSASSLYLIQTANCSLQDLFYPYVNQDSCSEIFEILSDIIRSEEEHRFFTILLACRLLKSLNTNLSPRGDFTKIINDLLEEKRDRIHKICNSYSKPIEFVKFMELQWEFINRINWSDQIDLPLNYLIPSIDEVSVGISLENRRSITEQDINKLSLRVFFMIKYIHPSASFCKDFPLKTLLTCGVSKGESYSKNIGKLKNRKKHQVAFVSDFDSSERLIIDDPDYLIIGVSSNENKEIFIENTLRFSNISLLLSKQPLVLTLIIESTELKLKFTDTESWSALINDFRLRINDCKASEIQSIHSLINNLY